MAIPEEILRELEELPSETDPLASPILSIHRGLDGYISFERKKVAPDVPRGKQRENLFSIRTEEFENMFPEIREWLIADSYFTVNGMFRPAPYKSPITGLPGAYKSEKNLRYLNTCYVDLDVGRPPDSETANKWMRRPWQEGLAAAFDLMEQGVLPQASIVARSGQGIYLFWLLHQGDDPHSPTRYWGSRYPEKLPLYKDIHRKIVEILTEQAADRTAIDAARVLRTPGSLHTGANRNTKYLVRVDAEGHGYSYTLPELGRLLGVHVDEMSLPKGTRELIWQYSEAKTLNTHSPEKRRPIKNPGSAPNRRKGKVLLNALRCGDLSCLSQYQHGWKKGTRCNRLTLYAEFLRGAENDRMETTIALEKMARNCRPPYPSDHNDPPIDKIVKQVFTEEPRWHSNQNLVQRLGITAESARGAHLKTILTPEMREEPKLPPGGKRAVEKAERQAMIRSFIEQYGPLSSRLMREKLASRGIHASHKTINNEMNEMGYTSSIYRSRRHSSATAAEAEGQTVLPLKNEE